METKCTVVMPLYNKEEYLEQAINSVLDQKTDFKIELIIADDCSTDSSLRIAENYEYMYEGKITVFAFRAKSGIIS